jgi:hypothetical protein
MDNTAISTQLSVKYWHDKTINTQGWWRVLPLLGLAAAAVGTVGYYLVVTLIHVIKSIVEHQRQAAAAEAIRAAVNPKPSRVRPAQSKPEFSWVDALLDGSEKSLDTDRSSTYSPCTFDSTAQYNRDCGAYGEDVADSIHCR